MITKNILIAFRNLIKSKSFALTNIFGLSIGLTVTFIILSFVRHELSYENYHPDIEQINVIYWQNDDATTRYGSTPFILAKTIRTQLSDFEKIAQVSDHDEIVIKDENGLRKLKNFFYAEGEIFDILKFDFVYGSPEEFKTNTNSIILSRTAAEKHFGAAKNPVGESFILYSDEKALNLSIAGVIEDTPRNTHLRSDYLANMEVFRNTIPEQWRDLWGFNNPVTFLKLKPGISKESVADKIRMMRQEHSSNTDTYYGLINLTDLHLYTTGIRGFFGVRGDINKVYIYSAVALLTLLIACVNFINLSTVKSITRSKEIGIRKVIGANRIQLIQQLFMEVVILTFVALPLTIASIELLLPYVNQMFNRQLEINYLTDFSLLSQMIAIIVVVCIFSGLYTAVSMSSVSPIENIRNKLLGNASGSFLRKALITFQFVIFTGLLICSAIIFSQLDYATNSDPGYSKDQLLSITLPNNSFSNSCETFANELRTYPEIENISISSFVPPTKGNTLVTEVRNPVNKEEMIPTRLLFTDHNYLKTVGIEMSEGSFLSVSDSGKDMRNIVVNEMAIKKFGISDPVGKQIEMDEQFYTIKGVVKDFQFLSTYESNEPLVILSQRRFLNQFAIRLAGNNIGKAIDIISEKWKHFFPEAIMDYSFVDDEFGFIYKDDLQFANLIYFFTAISIFIAIIGLSGLAAFTAARKVKEIGIRKILGASVLQILSMMSKEIVIVAVLALVIVSPLCYYLMNEWLANFEYRVEMNFLVFVGAGLLTMLVALTIVIIRAIKAANTNPVKALRYE